MRIRWQPCIICKQTPVLVANSILTQPISRIISAHVWGEHCERTGPRNKCGAQAHPYLVAIAPAFDWPQIRHIDWINWRDTAISITFTASFCASCEIWQGKCMHHFNLCEAEQNSKRRSCAEVVKCFIWLSKFIMLNGRVWGLLLINNLCGLAIFGAVSGAFHLLFLRESKREKC